MNVYSIVQKKPSQMSYINSSSLSVHDLIYMLKDNDHNSQQSVFNKVSKMPKDERVRVFVKDLDMCVKRHCCFNHTQTKLWNALDLDLVDIYRGHARHLSPAGLKVFYRLLKALPMQYRSDLVTRTSERHTYFLDEGNGGMMNLWLSSMYSNRDFQTHRVTLVYLFFKAALMADTRTSDDKRDENLFNDSGLDSLHNIVWCLDSDSGQWSKGVMNRSFFDKMRKLYTGGRDVDGMREQFGNMTTTLKDPSIRPAVIASVKAYLKQHGVPVSGSVENIKKQVIGTDVAYEDVHTYEERLDAKTDHLVSAREVGGTDIIDDLYIKLAVAYTKRFIKYLDDDPDW